MSHLFSSSNSIYFGLWEKKCLSLLFNCFGHTVSIYKYFLKKSRKKSFHGEATHALQWSSDVFLHSSVIFDWNKKKSCDRCRDFKSIVDLILACRSLQPIFLFSFQRKHIHKWKEMCSENNFHFLFQHVKEVQINTGNCMTLQKMVITIEWKFKHVVRSWQISFLFPIRSFRNRHHADWQWSLHRSTRCWGLDSTKTCCARRYTFARNWF